MEKDYHEGIEVPSKDKMIFGIRPVMEAIQSGSAVEKLFIQRDLTGPSAKSLKDLLKEHHIPLTQVPVEKLNRLTRKNHQGVVCFLSFVEYYKVEDVIPALFEQGRVPLLLLLDRITDVRNFGAICRTAECMGVDAIIVPEQGGAMINADAMKSSAGAISNIYICKEKNLKLTLTYLVESGVNIVGCTEKKIKSPRQISFLDPVCIIMGSEENGISPEYLKLCDGIFTIPMTGKTASLNVSVATGMILYEVTRQRQSA